MSHHSDYLPDHPFWRFATKILSHAEAKLAALYLQNHFGFSINLLLFCCWHAEAGRGRLSKTDIVQLININANWYERILYPLDYMAARCQNAPLSASFKQELYSIQKLAEHIEQLMLTEVPVKFSRNARTPLQKLNDCSKNIEVYCKAMFITIDASLHEALVHIMSIAFPGLGNKEIQEVSRSILLGESPSLFAQKKLALD